MSFHISELTLNKSYIIDEAISQIVPGMIYDVFNNNEIEIKINRTPDDYNTMDHAIDIIGNVTMGEIIKYKRNNKSIDDLDPEHDISIKNNIYKQIEKNINRNKLIKQMMTNGGDNYKYKKMTKEIIDELILCPTNDVDGLELLVDFILEQEIIKEIITNNTNILIEIHIDEYETESIDKTMIIEVSLYPKNIDEIIDKEIEEENNKQY